MLRETSLGMAISAALLDGSDLLHNQFRPMPSGPARRTLDTLHAGIGSSRYMPHQGARECARRRRKAAAS